jgi:hypothetical protein
LTISSKRDLEVPHAKENRSKDTNEDEVHSEAIDTKNNEYENAREIPKEVFEKDKVPADTESRSMSFQFNGWTGEYDCVNCIHKNMSTETLDDCDDESIESIMDKAKAFAKEDD